MHTQQFIMQATHHESSVHIHHKKHNEMNAMVDKEEEKTEEDKEDSNNPEKSATAIPMVSAHTTVQNSGNPP